MILEVAKVNNTAKKPANSRMAPDDPEILFDRQAVQLAEQSRSILEFGAGRGVDRVDLRGDGRTVHGCDVDPAVLQNPFVDKAAVLTEGALPYPDESFDLIVSRYVFEHVDDADRVAIELQRVLKPGGVLLAITPNAWGYVAVVAALIPNRLHTFILKFAQPNRLPEDVFPTHYKLNTMRDLKRHFGKNVKVVFSSGNPSYDFGSDIIWGLFWAVHKILPNRLHTTMRVEVTKPAESTDNGHHLIQPADSDPALGALRRRRHLRRAWASSRSSCRAGPGAGDAASGDRGAAPGAGGVTGQAHDLDGADALLPQMQADTLLADKAYDADQRVIEPLRAAGKTPVIPPKANRKAKRLHDEDLYEARHLIENFFCRLKQFRTIATRYDKRAVNFLAGPLRRLKLHTAQLRTRPSATLPRRASKLTGLLTCNTIVQNSPPNESSVVERWPLVNVKAIGVMINSTNRPFHPTVIASATLSQAIRIRPITKTPAGPAAATPSPENGLAFAFIAVV